MRPLLVFHPYGALARKIVVFETPTCFAIARRLRPSLGLSIFACGTITRGQPKRLLTGKSRLVAELDPSNRL